ncbi:hypothetical protein [Lysobacter enzymogenes]|uniref:Uncharacterized protein n=1 Tax=Lysobacter enzymogenes TaxID=69 RepID=A0A3N2RPE7_LYSEN|nr:hypothetical protein [Lysobacter enzymogenes]ROU09279.1 hypothetical protein D9T17_00130 [Lysobacter enzymogenes]
MRWPKRIARSFSRSSARSIVEPSHVADPALRETSCAHRCASRGAMSRPREHHGRRATIADATGVGSNPNKRRDCGSLAALLASRARPPRLRRLPPAAARAAQHGTHADFGGRPI